MRYFKVFLAFTLLTNVTWSQTAGSGFILVQEIEIGSAETGGINDLLTGVDLDSDGNGEIIVQIGRSTNAKAKIYEWDGTDSYDEAWSVSLPVSNSSSDQIQRLLAISDTDNDGNLELFVASSTTTQSDARIYCYEMSSGALSITNPSTTSKGPDGSGSYFQASRRIRAIIIGNADNDTYSELYVGNAGNTTSIEIWEANNDDSWTKVTLTSSEEDIGDGIMDMAPLADLDGDGNEDDLAICEQQGKLTIIDFSTLEDPVKATVNNANDTGTDTYGNVAIYDIDNSGNPEIIISNNVNDGIFVFEYVSGVYNRDKTDAVLLSIGTDIYSVGAQDFDADGNGEIYYTFEDDIMYYEFNSISGDFDASTDFSSSADLITGVSNTTFVIRPCMNTGNTLLDGDQLRDYVTGTVGHGTSGRGEIFIVESQTTDASLPVELSTWHVRSENVQVILNWVTESEINNLGFIIYRQMLGSDVPPGRLYNGWIEIASYKTHAELLGQGSATHRTEYQYVDTGVLGGQTYQYQLADVDYNGVETKHRIQTITVLADGIKWLPAYPNPFNPETRIVIQIGASAAVQIRAYDITGRSVATLFNEELPVGEHMIKWNGRNDKGIPLASGVYFLQLLTKETVPMQKVILIR